MSRTMTDERLTLSCHEPIRKRSSLGLLLSLGIIAHCLIADLQSAPKPSAEDSYYQIITLPIPAGIVLEAGALQLLPDGRLASATRYGDIYLIEGAFENPPAHLKFT